MSIQDDVDVLGFEIVRRAILFTSSTLLSDKTSRLGYNGDPNLAGTSTDGEALLYNSPIGTLYIQDDGTMWRKSVNTPETKTWVLMGEGSGGGDVDDTDLIELTSTVQDNSAGWGMHTDVSELTNTVQTNSAEWGAGGGGGSSRTMHVINRGSFDLNMYSCPGEPHFLSMQENNFAADTVWEDLTYRWKENDPKVELLKDDGFKTTPTPKMSWDNLTPYDRRSFAVPEGDKFWDADEVIQPVLPLMSNGDPLAGLVEPPESLFRLVKYALPENNISEPIASVMLAGRFALRLGFNNRSHDYDMMDGDPKSSGPFFEQLYPYQTIYEADNQEYIPLYNFKSQKNYTG